MRPARDRPLRISPSAPIPARTASSRHFAGKLPRPVRLTPRGREHGYGAPTWPRGTLDRHRAVGYADGFRRDLTGTAVRVAGERRTVAGTISMDAFASSSTGSSPSARP